MERKSEKRDDWKGGVLFLVMQQSDARETAGSLKGWPSPPLAPVDV